jgi:hypothetical protein
VNLTEIKTASAKRATPKIIRDHNHQAGWKGGATNFPVLAETRPVPISQKEHIANLEQMGYVVPSIAEPTDSPAARLSR